MGAKRILPWVQDLNGWMKAATKIGTWYAHEDGCWRLPDSWSATMTKGNLDDATAICEADYIQRCTEFLSLYNPSTHVVVSRECVKHALITVRNYGDFGTCEECNRAVAELRAALEEGK